MGSISRFEKIEKAEEFMLGLPQASCNVRHIFGPGLYIRELSIKAGAFAIGHYQKTPHMNVMLKGRVTMVLEDGSTQELVAPQIFVCGPGRKTGYINEDMIWLNIYATSETSVDKLEAEFLEKSETFNRHQKLIAFDDGDYQQVLTDLGVTAERVYQESCEASDLIDFPYGSYKVKVSRSGIHGHGLIATSDILAGEPVCPARIDGKRTPAGRYTNHSKEPNAEMVLVGDDLYLVAIRDIPGSRGGDGGEEITVDYRKSFGVNAQSRIAT